VTPGWRWEGWRGLVSTGSRQGRPTEVARAPRLAVCGPLLRWAALWRRRPLAWRLRAINAREPGLQVALTDWITVPYILSGVIAWWRRPDSRFGPLMLGAGFVSFLTTLQSSNVGVPHTTSTSGNEGNEPATRP
jgi:hypothetical protein